MMGIIKKEERMQILMDLRLREGGIEKIGVEREVRLSQGENLPYNGRGGL